MHARVHARLSYCLVAFATAAAAHAGGFVIDDVILGDPTISYVDPEFLPDFNRACWQDNAGRLWVGQIDANTGLFVSPDGQDLVLDTDLPNIGESFNGPEWGRDLMGASLFYVRPDDTGVNQVFKFDFPSAGAPLKTQLTTSNTDLLGPLVSVDRLSPDVRFFTGDINLAGQRQAYWGTDANVGVINELPSYGGIGGGRWIPGTTRFVYVADQDGPQGPNPLELAIFDTLTGLSRFVTSDGGNKVGPWPFFAPELGGELLLMVNISNQGIAIYRDLNRPDGIWDRIATLRIPPGTGFTSYFSAEPLEGLTGVRGVSYFSVGVSEIGEGGVTADASIWVLGLGQPGAPRFARRVDIGAATGETGRRLEPESHRAAEEIFIYYSSISPAGASQLRRARSGLFLCSSDVDGDGVVAFSDITEILSTYGLAYPTGQGRGDANSNGFVTFSDITEVLANLGSVCPSGPVAR